MTWLGRGLVASVRSNRDLATGGHTSSRKIFQLLSSETLSFPCHATFEAKEEAGGSRK